MANEVVAYNCDCGGKTYINITDKKKPRCKKCGMTEAQRTAIKEKTSKKKTAPVPDAIGPIPTPDAPEE